MVPFKPDRLQGAHTRAATLRTVITFSREGVKSGKHVQHEHVKSPHIQNAVSNGCGIKSFQSGCLIVHALV